MTRHAKYTTIYIVPQRSSQPSGLSCLHGVGCRETAVDPDPQPRRAVRSSHPETRTYRRRSSRRERSSPPEPHEQQRSVTPDHNHIVDDWLNELPECPSLQDSSVHDAYFSGRPPAPPSTEPTTTVLRSDHIPRYPHELGPQSAEAVMTNHGARPPLGSDPDAETIIVVTHESRTRPASAGHYRPRHAGRASSHRRRDGSVGSKYL